MTMSDRPNLTPGKGNTIEDKAPKPKGVIPRNTQSLVIMGIAVLMILIMWLTGGGKNASRTPKPTVPTAPSVIPTDAGKIQDFKQTIQSEQRRRQPVPIPEANQAGGTNVPGVYSTYGASPAQAEIGQPQVRQQFATTPYPPDETQSQQANTTSPLDSLKAEQKKREYLSLFAPNVAITYRKGDEAEKLTASTTPTPFGSPATTGETVPVTGSPDLQSQALRDAQTLAALGPPPAWMVSQQAQTQGNTTPQQLGQQTPRAEAKPVNPDSARPGEFNSAQGKKHVLLEGTVIETVLINRLDGTFSGPVNCLVTNDIYSHDRQHVLIPSGTKVFGEAQKVSAFGQQRLSVFFHRLIMPDGYSVSLDQFKGLDQVGVSALRDKVNNHYMKIFGASLAVGILGGVAQVGTGNVFTESAIDRARVGFGESMALAGERILDRFLNILPTVTIREGTRVKVYLSDDLFLPDYNEHTMRADL